MSTPPTLLVRHGILFTYGQVHNNTDSTAGPARLYLSQPGHPHRPTCRAYCRVSSVECCCSLE